MCMCIMREWVYERAVVQCVRAKGLSTTDEAPGRNVFSICPLLFFLVSYSPFCLSSCLLKKIRLRLLCNRDSAVSVPTSSFKVVVKPTVNDS